MALTVEIKNTASPALTGILAAFNGRKADLNEAMASSVGDLVKDHFRGRSQTEHNHFGARSSFWARMYKSVRTYGSAEAGTVAMGREVALRYFGGTVKPKGGKRALTIPVDPRAYGKRASQIDGLRLIKTGTGASAHAVLAKPVRKGSKELGLRVYYILVPRATIKEDKSVLPNEEAMRDAAAKGVAAFVDRLMEKSK